MSENLYGAFLNSSSYTCVLQTGKPTHAFTHSRNFPEKRIIM